MKKALFLSLLAAALTSLASTACDKAPDVNAKGELKALPPGAAAGDRAGAAAAPPAQITNGADMKVSTGLEQKGVSTGLEQKGVSTGLEQKGAVRGIDGVKGAVVTPPPGSPVLTNGQKGPAR